MASGRKILFLPRWYPSDNDPQNGVFIRKHAQAAALLNEVVVLIAEPVQGPGRITIARQENLTEIIVYYPKRKLGLGKILAYLLALRQGWQIIRQSGFSPQLSHVEVIGRQALLALWLYYRHQVPYVVTEHWSGYLTGQFQRKALIARWFSAWVLRRAAAVSVVSEILKKGMAACGLRMDYCILPNVVEVLTQSKMAPVSEKFTFLVVADLRDEVKNISGIIRAFARVYQDNKNMRLVIAGDGPDRTRLLNLVHQTGIAEAVIFKGRLHNQQVQELIAACHVVIVNSFTETFSVITLEAIFTGRPVIATRCGGPEQFVHADNGMLIPPGNEIALAEAMISIYENYHRYPPERVRLSVPHQFSLQAVAQTMERFYSKAGVLKTVIAEA
ncbi:MAG: glycosyl transferase [Chitinophagales bacterium]|nr:MAG: glycosyl transferase [Chitinophagales bacterium]